MKHLLKWMGEHPYLTVILALIVGSFCVSLIQAVRG
jgi:hypothetical protein